MHKAYLGMGGNIGDPKKNILDALALLQTGEKLIVSKISSFYETAPVGYEEQDWFANIVAEVETILSPDDLLTLCNEVEQALKRERLIRWGPRTIDIDILLYEGFESHTQRLTVPHPRMTERAFVIMPLLEIAPQLYIDGQSIQDIAQNLKDQEIRKLKND